MKFKKYNINSMDIYYKPGTSNLQSIQKIKRPINSLYKKLSPKYIKII